MNYQIYQWKDIESIFLKSSILLGNGASIAVNNSFNYQSLREIANSSSLIQNDEENLFNFFETNDFEQILKIVWQANNVNKILKVEDKKTQNIYHSIRDSLIKAVHEIHPDYKEIYDDIINISNFLKKFKIIVSLNYDLIVYWSILYDNEQKFTDCFLYGKFDFDNNNFCTPYNDKTKVFYPHGNLILAYDKILNEVKLQTDSYNLIQSITREWESENYNPLFISEGSSQQKINAIQRSNYLNTVYRNVLPRLIRNSHFSNYRFFDYKLFPEPSKKINAETFNEYNTLVIYGFGFGDQDEHIINKILNNTNSNSITCIAISVYNKDIKYCDNILLKLNKYKNLYIYFFDSQSLGCWNNA